MNKLILAILFIFIVGCGRVNQLSNAVKPVYLIGSSKNGSVTLQSANGVIYSFPWDSTIASTIANNYKIGDIVFPARFTNETNIHR